MILSLQYPSPDLRQQRVTGRCRCRVDAYGQRIDEQPDQPFQLGATTARDRAANHHLGLTGKTRQQCAPRSQQGHVQGDALPLRQRAQAGGQLTIQSHVEACTGKILLRRTRPVGRQCQQCRCAFQRLPPIGSPVLQTLAAHPALLPDRIVGVLNAQRWQWIGLAAS